MNTSSKSIPTTSSIPTAQLIDTIIGQK